MVIKIYGLPRSGTNYLKGLIELNLKIRCLSNIFGSKHLPFNHENFNLKNNYSPFNDDRVETDITKEEFEKIKMDVLKNDIIFIIIHKPPVKWLFSYLKFLNLYENFNARQLNKCIQIYNSTYRSWFSELYANKSYKTLIINYDTLIKYPKESIKEIGKVSGFLNFPVNEFLDITKYLKKNSDIIFNNNSVFSIEYDKEKRLDYFNLKIDDLFDEETKLKILNEFDFSLHDELVKNSIIIKPMHKYSIQYYLNFVQESLFKISSILSKQRQDSKMK